MRKAQTKPASPWRLPPQLRERLLTGSERRKFHKAERIIQAGSVADGCYWLLEGRVSLIAHLPGQTEKVLDILLPGSSFGEAYVILKRRFGFDAVAESDVAVLRIKSETMLTEIRHSPDYARHLLNQLSKQLIDALGENQSHALSATQRFVQLLLRYAPKPLANDTISMSFPASKAEIASRIDLSPEHLSRILRNLSDRGWIKVAGPDVTIMDPVALRTLVRS
jgi:CRP-like cAMP-binding protein